MFKKNYNSKLLLLSVGLSFIVSCNSGGSGSNLATQNKRVAATCSTQSSTINGTIDTSFASSGVASFSEPSPYNFAEVLQIETLRDCSGYLAYYASYDNISGSNGRLIKFDNTGTVDTNFGTNGVLKIYNTENSANAYFGYALTSDGFGDIYLAGKNASASNSLILMKFKADGSTDSSFGTNGKLSLGDIGVSGQDETPTSIQVFDSGELYVSGRSGETTSAAAWILKLNSNGDIDSTFGSSGVSVIDTASTYDNISKIKVLNDFSILAFGQTDSSGDHIPFIIKLLSNGSLDSSFATSGRFNFSQTISSQTSLNAQDFTTDSLGNIYAAGTNRSGSPSVSYIFKLNANGVLDTGFNTSGFIEILNHHHSAFHNRVRSLVIDRNDELFAAFEQPGGANGYDYAISKFLTSDGSLDTTFATSGRFSFDSGVGSDNRDYTRIMGLDFNNKLMLAGPSDQYKIGTIIRVD
ncbi:MAG: hypothetical protein N4A33_05420 [Bacteriovoracaceae bacterium]|jgi:uncharacterized delta-60 repeat protein|nr:hypothetical protein [Bacteriovoracaceae bacterium]